jgi:hypothetical protein
VVRIKAVSEIISVVMIVVISIGLISAAYLYGLPLIQKSQDKSTLERIISFFDYYNPSSLPQKVEFVANTGFTEVLTLDAQGIWEVHPFNETSPLNNSIIFSFFSKVTNINISKPISLTTGESCPPTTGTIGKDSFSVVCISGNPIYDGFNITYFIFFRNLILPINETNNVIYSIQLISQNGESKAASSTGKTIRISRQSVDKKENFIVTKVKIEIS